MAFDFPSSPTVGQQFTVAAGKVYVWNGYGWISTPAGGVLLAVQVFTSTGTYTPTPGLTHCICEVVAGGGAGGGVVAAIGYNLSGAGGGAGGYSRKYLAAALIGASKPVTVGAGGTPVISGAGNAGGASSVGTLCIANGGSGGLATSTGAVGTAGAGGAVAGAVGDVVVAGSPGHYGFFCGIAASGILLIQGLSHGGSSVFGGGGLSGLAGGSGTATGGAGTAYGAGGGGGNVNNTASSNQIGGAGAAGVVIITEFIGGAGAGVGIQALIPPQGRLTLQSATPVMTTTQAAKTTIYYSPYLGSSVPIYDGVNFFNSAFAELSVLTTDTTKSPAAIGASKCNDWFVWSDAGTLRLGHGPDWTNDTTRSAGTALTRINGIWLNNAAITNGPAASRGTYVGTTRSNASSQLDWKYGTTVATGGPGFLGVWNAFNRVDVASMVGDSNSTAAFSATTLTGPYPAGMQHSFVCGLAEDTFELINNAIGAATVSGFISISIGYDSTNAFSGNSGYLNASATAATVASFRTTALGFHNAYQIVATPGGGSPSVWGNGGASATIQTGFWLKGRM